MTIYTPLQTYLANQKEASVAMTYAQIEALLGRKLPPTAYGDHRRQWWANTETHSQALAWLRANRKAKLSGSSDEVTFVRNQDETPGAHGVSKDASSQAWLQDVTPSARRLLEDVAEEEGLTLEGAAIALLNKAAARRRRATLDWFADHSTFSKVSSVELIRADRDGH